jgi:hypothetical protein
MKMKRLSSTLICTFTLVTLLCSVAVPTLAVQMDPAEAPEWEEGSKWAYGMEYDVGAELGTQLQELSDMLEDEVECTVDDLSVDGEMGLWIVFEVTEASDEVYVLSMRTAAMMSLEAGISVTAEMPKAGTYEFTELFEIETEEITMSVDASFEAALVIDVDITFERDTMALESIDLNVAASASMDLNADNIPMFLLGDMFDDDYDENTSTSYDVSYEDFDISGEMELDLALEMVFDPALNLWDFPINVGEEWYVNSEGTLSGTMSGFIDVQGLPEEWEDEMFDDSGITGFPIVFEELNGDDDFPFENGVLEETTENIEFGLRCLSASTVNTEKRGYITVYKINIKETPLMLFYSPEVSFLSQFSMNTTDLEDMIPIPGMTGQEIEMEEVEPEVAEEKINEISDYQGGISDGGSSDIAGLFTESPYLGVILIVVIVIVVVAAVLLVRKK